MRLSVRTFAGVYVEDVRDRDKWRFRTKTADSWDRDEGEEDDIQQTIIVFKSKKLRLIFLKRAIILVYYRRNECYI